MKTPPSTAKPGGSTAKTGKAGKANGGRPEFEITEEVCRQAESLAAHGMTQTQIALALGMGESTLYEKKAQYPEFAEAIKRGKAKGIMLVTKALMEKVKGLDTASIIFYLKTQAGWKEAPQVLEHTGPDGKPLAVPTLADFYKTVAIFDGKDNPTQDPAKG